MALLSSNKTILDFMFQTLQFTSNGISNKSPPCMDQFRAVMYQTHQRQLISELKFPHLSRFLHYVTRLEGLLQYCTKTEAGWRSQTGRGEIFLHPKASRPALEPTQPPTQCASEAFFSGIKRGDVKLTTHFHLVPILRIGGAVPLLPYIPSRCSKGQL
jgi:hypothetical protein